MSIDCRIENLSKLIHGRYIELTEVPTETVQVGPTSLLGSKNEAFWISEAVFCTRLYCPTLKCLVSCPSLQDRMAIQVSRLASQG